MQMTQTLVWISCEVFPCKTILAEMDMALIINSGFNQIYAKWFCEFLCISGLWSRGLHAQSGIILLDWSNGKERFFLFFVRDNQLQLKFIDSCEKTIS